MNSTRDDLISPSCGAPQHTPAEQHHRAAQLRALLFEAVGATSADGILLSGGLDTSILATIAAAQGRRLRAVLVSVADAPGPDEAFARLMSERLGFELRVLRPRLRGLVERMPEVIRILRTFDPMELRNSIVTYLALEAAQDWDLRAVLTGDAADELFAGYSYMFNMPPADLPVYIRHLNEIMHFTSLVLAPEFGVRAELPYFAPSIRQFALTLESGDLVVEREGRRFGKRILREVFTDLLTEEVVWRIKTPIEFGSGSTALRRFATEAVYEEEFRQERERIGQTEGVRLRDKEQYFYFRLFRRFFPPPLELEREAKTCGECGGPVARVELRYCRICGAFPI